MVRAVVILQSVDCAQLLRNNTLKEVLSIALPNKVAENNRFALLSHFLLEVKGLKVQPLIFDTEDEEEIAWVMNGCFCII